MTLRQQKPDSNGVSEESGHAAPRPRIEMLDVKPDRLKWVREVSYYVIPSLLLLVIWWLAIEIFNMV